MGHYLPFFSRLLTSEQLGVPKSVPHCCGVTEAPEHKTSEIWRSREKVLPGFIQTARIHSVFGYCSRG